MKENKKEATQKAFSQRLRELRKTHRHTQAQLAQKLHVSKSCISNWEKGVRIAPTDMISKIADIYGVRIEYLIGSMKRPQPYVPEDKFIDKDRYLDLSLLCPRDRHTIQSFYEYLCATHK